MKDRSSERGQALVLIIFAIVALMGFAALAVDGGRIYAERRRAQSAADAAALSAAYEAAISKLPTHEQVFVVAKAKALSTALENGYDGVTNNKIEVHSPPTHGDYEECDCEYIQVIIKSHVDPVFAQFVFSGQENITTEAIARGRRSQSTDSGNAIHALSKDPHALEWDGTLGLTVVNGDVYSNGGADKNGSAGFVKVYGGHFYVGNKNGWDLNGSQASVSPAPEVGVGPQMTPTVPTPYCPDTDMTIGKTDYYVHNGTFTGGDLKPGIHCFNGDIQLKGQDTLTGDKVLLVMQSGGISVDGGATLKLKRANDIKDKYDQQFGGMLIFAPPTNHSVITLGGNSDSWFVGTVYAPGATCDLGGTSQGMGLHSSVICDFVKLHGTTDLKIVYQMNENYQMPPIVELIE